MSSSVYGENLSIIENESIRLGVDLDLGGSITLLESKEKPGNLINSHDWGRQVQMSFYSGPVPYKPNGKSPNSTWMGIGWNPIQSGDYKGFQSKILEHSNDGKEIYVKCIPMHWPLDNEPAQCIFESWLHLEGNRVHARARMINHREDKTRYAPRAQELPAVYTNGPYYKVMSYTGKEPFTDGDLERFTKVWTNEKLEEGFSPWSYWVATEGWAALVNDEDWGLGVWSPETLEYNGGFFGKTGVGGPKDASTGYLAPRTKEIIDYNIDYEYQYVLIVDSLQAIRDWVKQNHGTDRKPDYFFKSDRQHCVYRGAEDQGWPIEGEIRLTASQKNPLVIGPTEFWKAEDMPTISIDMAYQGESKKGRVLWKTFADQSFKEERSVDFEIDPDGEFHTYSIALSEHSEYQGALLGIGVHPALDMKEGDTVRIRSISYRSTD
ncbi:MAG: hypothetical protein KC931_03150 [Candidatus Omnitrophica bacterium]|nr:hypothetical protein [Candidatus Omnitrophota bacterium]